MLIESQLNLNDRTLIGGNAIYDVFPDMVKIGDNNYKVIGISHGTLLPKVSMEIEPTSIDLRENIVIGIS